MRSIHSSAVDTAQIVSNSSMITSIGSLIETIITPAMQAVCYECGKLCWHRFAIVANKHTLLLCCNRQYLWIFNAF
ncbi:hypothetical protein QUB70_23850 [Microcoleus sp. A003_D6]|uniref:hypothetical protein n=1 Tax=Microcoleus sp. A003_D6 TaxID=3055266 RepID=UPI002FD5DD84